MTAVQSELKIQHDFQETVEEGFSQNTFLTGRDSLDHQKVATYRAETFNPLRLTPHSTFPARMIVVGTLLRTDDTVYKTAKTRPDCYIGVRGLWDSIKLINGERFEQWLLDHPFVALTVDDLTTKATQHFIELFEKPFPGWTNEQITAYRSLLVFGQAATWTKVPWTKHASDPKVLTSVELGHFSEPLERLHYRVVDDLVDCVFGAEFDVRFQKELLEGKGEALQNTFSEHVRKHMQQNALNNKNSLFCIREFPLLGQFNGKDDVPDFTFFINGIPVCLVELKSSLSGISEALKDYQTKPGYQGAISVLLSNGHDAVFASTPNNAENLWQVYDDNMGLSLSEQKNMPSSTVYLGREVLSHGHKLQYLLQWASFLTGKDNSSNIFCLPRPQQWQALAKWKMHLECFSLVKQYVLMQGLDFEGSFDNRLVAHAQRTGKTKTMTRMLRVALALHPDIFDVAVVQVGEVDILTNLEKDIGKEADGVYITTCRGLADPYISVERPQTRQGLKKILKKALSKKKPAIILANTQKIDDFKLLSQDDFQGAEGKQAAAPLNTKRVLIILDEAHLGQASGTAHLREDLLPGATNVVFTATPKADMKNFYQLNKPFSMLDSFDFFCAQKAGLVVPILYKRVTISSGVSLQDVARLSASLEQARTEDAELYGIEKRSVRGVKKAFKKKLKESGSHIQDSLDVIVEEMQERAKATGRNEEGTLLFTPRGMIFEERVYDAKKIIDVIQELNRKEGKTDPLELNMYKGLRFGLDTSDIETIDAQGKTFADFNPGISNSDILKDRLESERDDRVDILIAVGKYTKGYDNSKVCMVALMREIQEPSLLSQMTTRPATSREGKGMGVLLDLSMGEGNFERWKHSQHLFAFSGDLKNTESFLYTEERVEHIVKEAQEGFHEAAKAAGYEGFADISSAQDLLNALKIETDEGKDKAREIIPKMAQALNMVRLVPDRQVFLALRREFLVTRDFLRGIRQHYPELYEDASAGNGKISSTSYSTTQLGRLIDDALSILKKSSLAELLDVKRAPSDYQTFDAQSVEAFVEDKNKNFEKDLKDLTSSLKKPENISHTEKEEQLLRKLQMVIASLFDWKEEHKGASSGMHEKDIFASLSEILGTSDRVAFEGLLATGLFQALTKRLEDLQVSEENLEKIITNSITHDIVRSASETFAGDNELLETQESPIAAYTGWREKVNEAQGSEQRNKREMSTFMAHALPLDEGGNMTEKALCYIHLFSHEKIDINAFFDGSKRAQDEKIHPLLPLEQVSIVFALEEMEKYRSIQALAREKAERQA